MLTTDSGFYPDLKEIVDLFEGGGALDVVHTSREENGVFFNRVQISDRTFETEDVCPYSTAVEKKRYYKRFAKLSLYKAISAVTGETMPWGALTGIRPVKLAYGQGEDRYSFLTDTMLVSPAKASLVMDIIEAQRGIYEVDGSNVDFFVGIPFCPTRCSYCSFVSSVIGKAKNLEEYVDALVREIAASRELFTKLRSVYVGGGTPISLPKTLLMRVLGALSVFQGVEYTVEAGRPDMMDKDVLALLKDSGVTRVCVNPQSFNDDTLRRIGRMHTAEQVEEGFRLARSFGFDINMDVIAGLPGEKPEDFAKTIARALALGPDNITVHTLCLKRGSELKESVDRLPAGAVAEMVDHARSELTRAGYSPYYLYRQKYMAGNLENTGYTLPGKICVYNVDVMEETASNIACGANAVSKRVFPKENRIERYGAPKDIASYIAKLPVIIEEKNKLFSGLDG